MEEKPTPFLTTPMAILLGSVIIATALLINGGVIKLNNNVLSATQTQTANQPDTKDQQPDVTLDQVKSAFESSLIKFGDKNNKVIALEIADPSCPYCHIAAGKNPELNKEVGTRFVLSSDGGSYLAPVPELKKLTEEGKASFAYIYFPGHGNGEMGTKAMYCAYEKNKFWEVHDLLMSNKGYDLINNTVKNDKGKSAELAEFLKPVFDPAVMKQCLDSGKYDDRLQADVTLATNLSINGTPGFFINASRYGGAYSYNDMEETVKSSLGI